MKRTQPLTLLGAAAIGAVVGFFLNHLLTIGGQPTFNPAVTMPVFLVVLAVIVVVLALPVRRATRGGASVNPFRAVRIAMLAKSSSLVGALLGGFAIGLGMFLMTRPIGPQVGSTVSVIATIVSAAVLVVAGVLAEHMCTIRKDDDDESPDAGVEAR